MYDTRHLFDLVETLPLSSRGQYLHAKGTQYSIIALKIDWHNNVSRKVNTKLKALAS